MRSTFEKVLPSLDRSFRCYRRVDPEFGYEGHHHPQYELTLIEDSSGRRFVGDHIDYYGPGDLVLIGPNVPHTWASDEVRDARPSHRAVVIQFDRDFLGPTLFDTPEMRHVAQLLDAAAVGLQFPAETFAEVRQLMSAMPDASPADQLMTLLSVLHTLGSRAAEADRLASASFKPTLNSDAQQRVETVCRHIQDHYTEELRQGDLAELAGMNASAFSRFFRRVTGRTLTDYINAVRVGSACRMLIETDRPIVDVCFRCGFNNVSNFNRRFRALRDCTPREFRGRFRE